VRHARAGSVGSDQGNCSSATLRADRDRSRLFSNSNSLARWWRVSSYLVVDAVVRVVVVVVVLLVVVMMLL
jgi:hypothetical protein